MRPSLTKLFIFSSMIFSIFGSQYGHAELFEVDPIVGEWSERFCGDSLSGGHPFAYCRAYGGEPIGNIYSFNCVGGDLEAYQALSASRQAELFLFHLVNACSVPTSTFSGWGQPTSSACWGSNSQSFTLGVESWSTGNINLYGNNGTQCNISIDRVYGAGRSRIVSCPLGADVQNNKCYLDCPAGEIPVNGQCDLPPQKDSCDKDNLTGNPCNVATGGKFRNEQDSLGDTFSFNRYYNTQYLQNGDFGVGWRSSFDRELVFLSQDSVVVVSPAGRGEQWDKVNNVWQGDADSKIVLTEIANGYRVTLPRGGHEDYNAQGQITSKTDSNSKQTTYGYNTQGQLTTVTDQYGNVLTLGYLSGLLNTVTNAANEVITYQYDSLQNLQFVIYPDTDADPNNNPRKEYHYENSNFPHHLTGITDENDDRYAAFSYDVNGKVSISELAITTNSVGQEKMSLAYTPDANPNDGLSSTTVTDAANTQELWSFEEFLGAKKLISKENQSDNKGLVRTYYPTTGYLDTETDAVGNVTKYVYNQNGQKESMTEAFGTASARVTSYLYEANDIDLVAVVTRPSVFSSNTTTVTTDYDSNLNVDSVTIDGFDSAGNAVTRTTSFLQDGFGKVTQIDGPRTDVSDITIIEYYDCTVGAECGRLEKVTNALGHVTEYLDYDAAGRLLEMKDAHDVVTVNTYHPRGWLLTSTQTPPNEASRLTSYNYDDAGQLKKITYPDNSFVEYRYNAAHELDRISDNLGNYIDYKYDSRGNRTDQTTHDPGGALVRSTIQRFDMRNFVDQINNGGSLTTFVNDAVGNLAELTDPNGELAADQTFDEFNRLTTSVDAMTNPASYLYTQADQIEKVTATNGAVTDYKYDDLGNLLQEISSDRGTVTYGHDAAGNVTSMTDARNVLVTYQYDALNRLTNVIYPNTSQNETYLYDSTCGLRLCEVTDASGTTTYKYDDWGNTTEQKWQGTTASYRVNYLYDAMDRVSTVTYPSRRIIEYERDALGRVDRVLALGDETNEIIADSFTYRADGLRTGFRAGNGRVDLRTYDLQGQLTHQYGDGVLMSEYDYDDNGNIKNLDQVDQERDYDYDVLNRLTDDDWLSGTVAANDWIYNYDANGNRINHTQNTTLTNFSYTPNTNRMSAFGGQTVTTDAAGNVTDLPRPSGSLGLFYNEQGHVFGVLNGGVSTTYTYNYARQRKEKAQGLNKSVYAYDLQGRLMATLDSAGRVYEEYLYANQSDMSPVQHRVFKDTESDTLEAQAEHQKSIALLKEPDDNTLGQCQSFSVGSAERYGTGALFEELPSGPGGPPIDPYFGKFVPTIIYFLLDDDTGGTSPPPDPDPIVGVDSQVILISANTVLTWPQTTGASEYVIDVATSATALNQGVDIARSCAQGNTSALISDIPMNNTDVYIRIWSKVNGVWQYDDYQLSTSGIDDEKIHLARTYPVADHLGTPRFVHDDDNTLVWRWAGDAFALEAPQEDVDNDGIDSVLNMRFPGQYYDNESGLLYNWNRYYDSETGRYVNSDLVGMFGGLNTYNYVHQNPLHYYDADGNIPIPLITGGIGAFIGGVTGYYSGGVRGAIYGAAGGFIGGALGGVGTGVVSGASLGTILSTPIRGGVGRSLSAAFGGTTGTLASTLGPVGQSFEGGLDDGGTLPSDPPTDRPSTLGACEPNGCCWVIKSSFWKGNQIVKECPPDVCEGG